MGCGQSSARGVIGNRRTVTQNGASGNHLQPETAASGSRFSAQKDLLSELNLNDPELQEAATRIQAQYRGYRTRSKIKMAQEEVDIDLNDPDVASAAAKIQASFRGHQKKRVADKEKAETELSESLKKLSTKDEKTTEEEEEELPDLSDPELNKAATKIQAQFRGHMVRKTDEKESESK